MCGSEHYGAPIKAGGAYRRSLFLWDLQDISMVVAECFLKISMRVI